MGSSDPQQIVTNSTIDVVLVPGIIFLIGIIFFGFSIGKSIKDGYLTRIRFVGYGLVGLALIMALPYFYDVINPGTGYIYRLSLRGRYVTIAHWSLAPTISVGLAILYLIERWASRVIVEESSV